MWSKITNALRNHATNKDEQPSTVMSKVFEQHPNLSVFHPNESGVLNSSPPPSPSVHDKRSMYKRLSRPALKDDADAQRAPSPTFFKLPSTISKKAKNPLNSTLHPNSSQPSLNINAPGPSLGRSSFDALQNLQDLPYPSQGTAKSTKESRRRPSLDMLRQESSRPLPESFAESDLATTSGFDGNFNSVRSILRDPHTPGTGQNVRFFSREAFKLITPDQSATSDLDKKPQPAIPQQPTTLLDQFRSSQISSSSTPPSNKRLSPNSKSRPTVAEIFSPLNSDNSGGSVDNFDASLSLSNPMIMDPGPNSSNLFDVSQQLDMSSFPPPPGLDFHVNAPNFSLDLSANDHSRLLSDSSNDYPNQLTSTPFKPKDPKEKDKAIGNEESQEEASAQITVPEVVDDKIFHAQENSPKFPLPLHERSQSFSFGQTVFYSTVSSGTEVDKSPTSPDTIATTSLTEQKPASSGHASPTLMSTKTRTRSMSDSVFQTMLRSSASQPPQPEADINDESTTDIVVYAGSSEPDPFSAHANTYYTPQTMIPTTPPKGNLKHVRKTSKEESLIISLQTQLALRTELCGHYEADLKARDQVVEVLGKKLAEFEKDDSKRKNALRVWKKKVQELERVCRQLEEVVEDSKQESMERSVMDEASSEALRTLHRQIAGLEREKNDWLKREQGLREEIDTLESLVRDRSQDIINLKETLWNRDESEQALQRGIRDAKEQMEMMGNISIGMVDEEEVKKLMVERDQMSVMEKERHRAVELDLQQEVEELQTKYESLQVEKAEREEELEQFNQQLKSQNDEYTMLKAELEAQWDRTAKASEKIETLERENDELTAERDALKVDVKDLETRTSEMELEWNESENQKNKLEAELQEVWNFKDALEKERDELQDVVHQVQEQVSQLAHNLQERDDRISELEQEQQFAHENVARLEENLRIRDTEISQITQRILDRESEVEDLHEEMSTMKRQHDHLVNEQTRALHDATVQQDGSQARMDQLVRAKAEADVEIKTSRDRIIALKEEVERLRRHVHNLQQESADKEVKVAQMTKQHTLDKEDIQGLNIALDSKQQELELLKRKIGAKGTAGSTPAQPSKVPHRRDSSIFTATPLQSRPPSVASDSGTDAIHFSRKKSSEMALPSGKPLALGKSARVNGSGTSSISSSANRSVARTGIDGCMGPPPSKSRPSIGTPTPSTKGPPLSRSSSARPAVTTPTALHRRISSTNSEHNLKAKISLMASPAPSVLEQDEKENVGDRSTASSRVRSMIPTLA